MQISAIVNADDEVFEISTTKALQISSEIKPALTKKAAETLLGSLVEAGWFIDL
jgi:hypothetical protein